MSLNYGLTLPHGATKELAGIKDPVEAYEALTEIARLAEEVGFSSIWLSDVLWPGEISNAAHAAQDFLFECWSTTAALARDTRSIRIGQLVTYSGLRNPALLAKMASTIDVMSHGRLTLGIGSGSPMLASQFQAYGYDYPDIPVRSRQLREAVQILIAMWTQEEATFAGQYYQVHGAINQPKGVQQPHIPLLIGGNGEQVTLKLVAQYGAACNIYGDPDTLQQKLAVLQKYCETLGRDYQEIRRTTGSICVMGASDEEALAQLPEGTRNFFGKHGLVGTPTTIRQRITAFEEAGIQELMLRFPGTHPLHTLPEALRSFARQFIR